MKLIILIVCTSILMLDKAIFLTFLVLKLTEYITWSWWWITSPLWITILSSMSILIFQATNKKSRKIHLRGKKRR